MNRMATLRRPPASLRGLVIAACIVCLAALPLIIGAAAAATTIPVLWTAGGLDAGSTGAGQAARIATDSAGNIAVVSGPALARDLAVTSYTAAGSLRWRSTVSPTSGTFQGDWVAAAPNGDFLAVGRNVNSSGSPIALTLVRYSSTGALLWRIDLARTLPSVGRLVVDSAGNAYLVFSALGDGQDIQLHKYSPAGALLWSQTVASAALANDIASSLALGPDESDVVLTGSVSGGSTWITAAYNTATGARKWLVTAPEGVAARDLVVDPTRVYVTGQGNVGISAFLSVVAYDRNSGARLWRTDKKPADGTGAAGLRIALAPGASIVATGQATRGFLDWYTVALETTGAVRWEAVRDGGLNTDEIPRAVFVMPDGVTVVTGPGGPNLPGGYIQGVTAGYNSAGALVWEAFAGQATVWAVALPNADVCATGGYDALVTCWRVAGAPGSTPTPGPTATSTNTPAPTSTPAPVTSTGYLAPSANAAQTVNAGDNDGYQSNPANAYANDAAVATDTNSGTTPSASCADSGKDRHAYSDYNFSIPAAAVIQGIQVRVDARADATNGSPKICVQLSADGGATWTTEKSTATLSRTETTYLLGSSSDTWGRSWSAGSFANANFRVRITDVATNASRDFFLDYVAVNVTYKP